MKSGEIQPDGIRFFLKVIRIHGWNQLQEEMKDNSWIIAPAKSKYIFKSDNTLLWREVMKEIGSIYSTWQTPKIPYWTNATSPHKKNRLPADFSSLYSINKPNLLVQVVSDSARISLLTCSAGEELYSAFGHNGIRVTDFTKRFWCSVQLWHVRLQSAWLLH